MSTSTYCLITVGRSRRSVSAGAGDGLTRAAVAAPPPVTEDEPLAARFSLERATRALDTTAMREILGFSTTYTTPETFDAFARRMRPGPINAQRVADIEESVAALIDKAVPHGRR